MITLTVKSEEKIFSEERTGLDEYVEARINRLVRKYQSVNDFLWQALQSEDYENEEVLKEKCRELHEVREVLRRLGVI